MSSGKKSIHQNLLDVLKKVPEANLISKPSNAERMAKLRNLHRKVKNSIESDVSTREVTAVFRTSQSRSQYEKQRMELYFGKKEDVVERVHKRKHESVNTC